MTENSKVLAIIQSSDDPAQLRRFIDNAKRMKQPEVEKAAFRRLVEILPQEEPGTVGHDFWRSIFALEEALTQERGRTTRLARTRQKIDRVGIKQTLIDLALSDKPAAGFEMLIEREMPQLTGEAVVLRHEAHFEPEVVAAARERLERAGVDVNRLPDRRRRLQLPGQPQMM